jgi:hypothetical protein
MLSQSSEGYPAKLQALSRTQAVDFLDMPRQGPPSVYQAGEGTRQPLPLSAAMDGRPAEVLFTVSVGTIRDEAGHLRPVGYPERDGILHAAALAARNFAVVHAPGAEEHHLVDLTPQELAAARCNYEAAQPQHVPPAHAMRIPGPEERPLELEVPLSGDPWEAPAHLQFQAIGEWGLRFGYDGPDAYAMVAWRV